MMWEAFKTRPTNDRSIKVMCFIGLNTKLINIEMSSTNFDI